MVQHYFVADPEQVVDTMIALTRLSNQHRAIVAGSNSMELYLSLRRRGFIRLATPATCPLARRQHTIALITGGTSLSAIEAALAEVSPFLGTSAAIAILVHSHEAELCLKIRKTLEQMGFRIEAGVRCHDGLVLSACRHGFAQLEQAA